MPNAPWYERLATRCGSHAASQWSRITKAGIGQAPWASLAQRGATLQNFRSAAMAIYQTGGYRVKPSAVDKVKQAIKVFVRYLQENEPGTKMYLAWQEKNDPTRFFHLLIFEDEAAQGRHGESAAVKQLSPCIRLSWWMATW